MASIHDRGEDRPHRWQVKFRIGKGQRSQSFATLAEAQNFATKVSAVPNAEEERKLRLAADDVVRAVAHRDQTVAVALAKGREPKDVADTVGLSLSQLRLDDEQDY